MMKTPFGVEILSEPACTYSDHILLPASNQRIRPEEISTDTCIGGEVRLKIPVVGSNMGHLGGRMAEKLAQLGGIGILSQDFRLQEILKRIRRVKEANPHFHMPIVLSPDDRTADALALMNKRYFDCVIVVDAEYSPLGIATYKDLLKIPIWEKLENVIKRDLAVVPASISTQEASRIMIEKQIHHLPVVDACGRLLGCFTPLDVTLRAHNYKPALDRNGRLLIGVAMGIKPKESFHPLDLSKMYLEAGADVLVLDVANGYLDKFAKFVAEMRKEIGERIPLVAGNVADYEGAARLLDAGCCTVKVGIGPGGACTTRRETGVGVPQQAAVSDSLRACREIAERIGRERYLIADGGIRSPHDLSIATVLGSSAVMIGSLLAGTYESAFETEIIGGEMWKRWRGNASSSAATYRRKEIYGEKYITEDLEQSEGADGVVKVSESVTHKIFRLVEGLKASMARADACDIRSFQAKKDRILRLRRTGNDRIAHLSELQLQNLYIKPQPSFVGSRKEVALGTALAPGFELNVPYVALPAPFVQKKICRILAQLGGIGFLGRKKANEDIERVAERVRDVKGSHPLYFLPSIQQPDEEIGKTIDFLQENAFSCVIIVRDFQNDRTPIGIATPGDLFDRPRTDSLREVVKSNMLTVEEGVDLRRASDIMLARGIHHLPVVDAKNRLVGCITPRDITLRVFHGLRPNTDANGRLRVGAALRMEEAKDVLEEASILERAGADILLLDTDNGYSVGYLESLRALRSRTKCLLVAAGVSTFEGAHAAFEAGADIVKVGSTGLQIPYIEALAECARAAVERGKTAINDDLGRIVDPREANFSLLLGASAIGLRDILAPTFENSMQSILAPPASAKKHSPHLIRKTLGGQEYVMEDLASEASLGGAPLKIKGSVISVIVRFANGLRSSCTYSNASNLSEYRARAVIGVQSASGYREGNPHAFSESPSTASEFERSGGPEIGDPESLFTARIPRPC